MKKILIILAIIICIGALNKDESIIIPKNAIRYRIIAASNSIDDQLIKNNLSKEIEEYLYTLTKDAKSANETKLRLKENKNNIEKFVKNYLDINKINTPFNISIGSNYFPKKVYKGVTYEEGYYDSIVINLGKGNGFNWWCVIYPPLCLIDEEQEEVEYTSLISETIEKFQL